VSASPHQGDETAARIGERLASLRTDRGLRVVELARRAGVSPSLVSQIERGQSRPSVTTLVALAEGVGAPIDALFREAAQAAADEAAGATEAEEPAERAPAPPRPGEDRFVVRLGRRATIEIEGGVRWERLTPATLEGADVIELVYAPGAESHPALYRHPGTEMVLVLSGTLDIVVGFERHRLEPGDSICFPSSTPHRYVNPGDETARAVTVLLHDTPPRNGA
jgi:transcriptional regulator with XRE-family HTH domain